MKTDELHYKSTGGKDYNSNEYSLPIVFLRDIHEGNLSLEDADDEQRNFSAILKNLDKGKKQLKNNFLSNLGLLFNAREKVLNNFKSRLFSIKNLDKFKHVKLHLSQQKNQLNTKNLN